MKLKGDETSREQLATGCFVARFAFFLCAIRVFFFFRFSFLLCISFSTSHLFFLRLLRELGAVVGVIWRWYRQHCLHPQLQTQSQHPMRMIRIYCASLHAKCYVCHAGAHIMHLKWIFPLISFLFVCYGNRRILLICQWQNAIVWWEGLLIFVDASSHSFYCISKMSHWERAI